MQDTSPQVHDEQTVIDVLLDGLRISDPTLNDKCLAAIVSIGERIVSHLLAAANDRSTRAPHHARLVAAAELVRDSPVIDARAGELILEAMFDALRVHNEKLNAKAIAAIGCMPSGFVNCLITEAVCKHKSRGHCARLLRAADEVDGRPKKFSAIRTVVSSDA